MGHHHTTKTTTVDEYSSNSSPSSNSSDETQKYNSPTNQAVNQTNVGLFQQVNQRVEQQKEKTTCCEWLVSLFKG